LEEKKRLEKNRTIIEGARGRGRADNQSIIVG